MKDTLYITTPIYYVNAEPHIGTAYTTLLCDVVARFNRLDNKNVKFLTGTDEYGQKIATAAEKMGIPPIEFVDQMSKKFYSLLKDMHISNDDFIRTTETRHQLGASALWKKLEKNGQIYLSKYSGWYSIRDESFYSEKELIEGKAPTGAEVSWVSEESYFFKLSNWQNKLLDFYENNPDFVLPKKRFSEIKNFVKSGLNDLSISRTSFEWGIKVPNSSNHVMYVWIEALSNYINAIGYPDDISNLNRFWPAVHLVGKDITKFHAIYWPALLMAAELPLPKQIVSHGWWLNEGEKISKSLGNTINPKDLISQYGVDQVRYYLLREISFGNDGNFTKESFIQRSNNELSNKLGNLVQRSLSLIYNKCDGSIPSIEEMYIKSLYKKEIILKNTLSLYSNTKKYLEAYEFNKALHIIFELVDNINVFFSENAPWELVKNDTEKLYEVLFVSLEAIRYVLILLIPFIPESANKLLDQINVPNEERNFKCLSPDYAIKIDNKIDKPYPVFNKIALT